MQQRRRVTDNRRVEVAGGAPGAGDRVVQFRVGQCGSEIAVIRSSGDQDSSILEECRCVPIACPIEAAGIAPRTGGRIVELGTVNAIQSESPRDQDLATLKQRRGVTKKARYVQAAREGPCARAWIV